MGKAKVIYLPSFSPWAESCHKWYLNCPGILYCWHLNKISQWIIPWHYCTPQPTFISNIGGTNVGRARRSATRRCLCAVWPEQNVNLLRSSCLRKIWTKISTKVQYHICFRFWHLWTFDWIKTKKCPTWNLFQLQFFPLMTEYQFEVWEHPRERSTFPPDQGLIHWAQSFNTHYCQKVIFLLFPKLQTCDSLRPRHSWRFPSPALHSWHRRLMTFHYLLIRLSNITDTHYKTLDYLDGHLYPWMSCSWSPWCPESLCPGSSPSGPRPWSAWPSPAPGPPPSLGGWSRYLVRTLSYIGGGQIMSHLSATALASGPWGCWGHWRSNLHPGKPDFFPKRKIYWFEKNMIDIMDKTM